jgi:hypothetical protein
MAVPYYTINIGKTIGASAVCTAERKRQGAASDAVRLGKILKI